MPTWLAAMTGILAGIASAAQSGLNASLGRNIGSLEGTLISFTVGAAAAGIGVLFFGQGQLAQAIHQPWYLLSGGILGFILVLTLIIIVPMIGTASATTALLAGQMLASMIIDHFGWLGMTVRPITFSRLAAAALLLVALRLMNQP